MSTERVRDTPLLGNLTYDGVNNYLCDAENRLIRVTKSQTGGNGELNAATDSDLTFATGGDVNWVSTDLEYYHDGNDTGVFLENHDSARSGVLSLEERSWMEARVAGAGTIIFHMKRSGVGGSDYSFFFIDGSLKISGSGNVSWSELSYGSTFGVRP